MTDSTENLNYNEYGDYAEALTAAGAEVLAFEKFGSYQGDWFAVIKYNNQISYVTGCYGSCSGCDAFEAEFGWRDSEKSDYKERLAKFGKTYLEDLLTFAEAIEIASKNSEWDASCSEMIEWLKKNER